MNAEVLVVSGTDTGVGKTIVTAAIAALAGAAGKRVGVIKAAQTGIGESGESGESDIEVITRLAHPDRIAEGARYRAPLAPASALRFDGEVPVSMDVVATTVDDWRPELDLILVEGAGGLLVGLDARSTTITQVSATLGAPIVLVTRADLGTLNHTALSLEAMVSRGVDCAAVIIGSWPDEPGLDCRCNLVDLPAIIGADFAGALPAGAGTATAVDFKRLARGGLAPRFGGDFDGADFRRRFPPL